MTSDHRARSESTALQKACDFRTATRPGSRAVKHNDLADSNPDGFWAHVHVARINAVAETGRPAFRRIGATVVFQTPNGEYLQIRDQTKRFEH